jgi:hypothetical protein
MTQFDNAFVRKVTDIEEVQEAHHFRINQLEYKIDAAMCNRAQNDEILAYLTHEVTLKRLLKKWFTRRKHDKV